MDYNYWIIAIKIRLIFMVHDIWSFMVGLVWKFNGTARRIEFLLDGNEDDMPAQVLRIIWKNPLQFKATPTSFFTVHERFAPAYIVLNDRVHLLSITSKTVTFTEVDCDILNVREHPFFFFAQHNFATRLIILPTKVFYDLVDKVDVADRTVVWMFHTTRCGSTAWVQAFNSLPGWTAFSEPQPMHYTSVFGDYKHSTVYSFSKTDTYQRYAIAAIKMQLLKVPKNGSVFWKATTHDEYLVNIIAEHFPKHRMLVAYRDVFPTVTSHYKSFFHLPFFVYGYEVLKKVDLDNNWWFNKMLLTIFTNGYDFEFNKKLISKVNPQTGFEWYTNFWATKIAIIRQAIQNGAKIKPIKYDSLVENRRETVARVFDYLDIPAENVDIACEALNHDSQAGTAIVSWESRNRNNGVEWSKGEGVIKRCNMILEVWDLPNVDSKFMLPNSI